MYLQQLVMAITSSQAMASNQEVNDTGTHLKCFRWSISAESRTGSSPNWFSRLLYRSSGKISAIPLQEEVSNDRKTGQNIAKEEYDRVVQKMNFLNSQLSKKYEEIRTLKQQISEKQEQNELSQQGSFQDSGEGQTRESVPKEEHDRVLQEKNSLSNQLSLREEEISEKDEQIYLLDRELRVINVNLGRLLLHLGFDASIRRTIIDTLSKTEDKTEEALLSLVASNYQMNKEEGKIDDKKQVSNRVDRDIIGAVPTPLRSGRPPKATVNQKSNVATTILLSPALAAGKGMDDSFPFRRSSA